MTQPTAVRRLAKFVIVGCAAAAVHWGLVVALVAYQRWHPLLANVLGWAVAFIVSFAGHHHLTFGGHGTPARTAAARFFVVSAIGFAINELGYALLLGTTQWRFDIALALVLVGVAGVTYVLSRHWVFRRNPVQR